MTPLEIVFNFLLLIYERSLQIAGLRYLGGLIFRSVSLNNVLESLRWINLESEIERVSLSRFGTASCDSTNKDSLLVLVSAFTRGRLSRHH